MPLLGETGGDHIITECPECGKPKVYINAKSKAWDCKVCGIKGGMEKLIYYTTKKYQKMITPAKLNALAVDRGLSVATLLRWGVGWNGSSYTVPVMVKHDICHNILRYNIGKRPYNLPGVPITCGTNLEQGDAPTHIFEGPWDAMAFDEAIRKAGGAVPIVFFPGANVTRHADKNMFDGKDIIIAYDNDAAGKNGIDSLISKIFLNAKTIQTVTWPESTKSGYDVRDLYKDTKDANIFISTFSDLLAVASTFTVVDRMSGVAPDKPIEYTEGLDYQTIVNTFREHLWLPNPSQIDIILGSFFANRITGDPVWLFVVGPPGCGKTAVLQATIASQLVNFQESITPAALLSGWNTKGAKDPSLIPRLNGKVLMIKDFTPLLSGNDFDRTAVFNILRGAFDGVCKRTFGNNVIREVKSRFGIIAGVTNVIDRFIDEGATLGERFLKYRMPYMRMVRYAGRAIEKALTNIGHEESMSTELSDTMQIALDKRIDKEDFPILPSRLIPKFVAIAQWVAQLRGVICRERYSGDVQIVPFTEVGTRLAKQLAKLAMGVAILHGRKEVSDYDFNLAVRVAHDTCPERLMAVIKILYDHYQLAEHSISAEIISSLVQLPKSTLYKVLNDMLLLGLVKNVKREWALSATMYRIAKTYRVFEIVEETSRIDATDVEHFEMEEFDNEA